MRCPFPSVGSGALPPTRGVAPWYRRQRRGARGVALHVGDHIAEPDQGNFCVGADASSVSALTLEVCWVKTADLELFHRRQSFAITITVATRGFSRGCPLSEEVAPFAVQQWWNLRLLKALCLLVK